jgi:hypothetical protein
VCVDSAATGEAALAEATSTTVTLAPDETVPLPDPAPVAIPPASQNPYPQRYK